MVATTSAERKLNRVVDAHGYRGETFTGARFARTLERRGSQFEEQIVLLLDDTVPPEQEVAKWERPAIEIVETGQFEVRSQEGPVVISDRTLAPDDQIVWISDALSGNQAGSRAVPTFVPTRGMAMARQPFWRLIGILGGRITPESVDALR